MKTRQPVMMDGKLATDAASDSLDFSRKLNELLDHIGHFSPLDSGRAAELARFWGCSKPVAGYALNKNKAPHKNRLRGYVEKLLDFAEGDYDVDAVLLWLNDDSSDLNPLLPKPVIDPLVISNVYVAVHNLCLEKNITLKDIQKDALVKMYDKLTQHCLDDGLETPSIHLVESVLNLAIHNLL